jgi:hypothetical protein
MQLPVQPAADEPLINGDGGGSSDGRQSLQPLLRSKSEQQICKVSPPECKTVGVHHELLFSVSAMLLG